jgi:hypothetical protein
VRNHTDELYDVVGLFWNIDPTHLPSWAVEKAAP